MRTSTELSTYIRAAARSGATRGTALDMLATNELQLFYLFLVWSGAIEAVHRAPDGPAPIELNLTDRDIASVMRGFK